MNRFKCPACGRNQYTACSTAEGCIYCGHRELVKMDKLEPEEGAGMSMKDKQEIDRLKEKLNAVLQDFYEYVQGGKEICAFCLHDYECEPGETICGATYKGFKWRGLNERQVEHDG